MTDSTFDAAMARTWLDVLYVNTPGLIHISSTGNWAGRAFTDHDQAAEYITHLDATKPEGTYLRATTLRGRPDSGGRGGEADSHALPGLWADLDIAGPGHKTSEQLPPDEDAARRIIADSGLPAPTIWVHSGGGLYPWWLLDRYLDVTPDSLADAKALSARWQTVIARSASALGLHYGTGVGDLARVLRIPGTINRKEGLARPCRIIDAIPTRYTITDLHAGLAAALERHPDPQPAPLPASRRLEVVRAPGEISPNDDFEARAGWDDALLLGGAGWRVVKGAPGQYCEWVRPGKTTEGISATTGKDPARDRMWCFSTDAGLPVQEEMTKPYVYAQLHHGGDTKAATRELARLGFGTRRPSAAEQQRAAIVDLVGDQYTARPLTVVDGTSALVLAEPAPAADRFGATQDGLARALVAHHGHELRFCPQRGRWLHWTGHRWLWDEAERHREMVRALARTLPEGEGWARFKAGALSSNGVTGVARLAQSDSHVIVHISNLDARPYELNTPAGIIDLRTGQLSGPDPAALHTRCTAVAPDFDRAPDTWTRFIVDTFGGDDDLAGYVQRLLGLSAIGTVLERHLPFGHGTGANGKSTLLEAAMHTLGFGETGYAIAAPAEMLMVRRHSEHPAELAQLAGARLVVCSELDDGQNFAEARIKQLTGRDSINARFMRRDPFTFIPSHTLWLLGNHKPAARTGGPAFWGRVKLIPFNHVVPESQRDPNLGEKLNDEAPGILAWMARGAADYRSGGMGEPDIVRKATEAYAADQDTVARWVEDACRVAAIHGHVRVLTSAARTAYERWCADMGEEPVTPKRFGMELRERFGVEVAKSNGRKFYAGLTVVETGTDSDDNGEERRWPS